MVLGRDGLVVNTAKYVDGQQILAVNPDPKRIDGTLLPFGVQDIDNQLDLILNNEESQCNLTISQAIVDKHLNLYGVNDIFIGNKTHQSARYTIRFRGTEERHSSSGVIVSTGVGSTGWFKSILTGALGITRSIRGSKIENIYEHEYKRPWDTDNLQFCVREPWASKISGTNIIYGQIFKDNLLEIESEMPSGGVIFSDGIETDNIEFNSGSVATIGIANKYVRLVVA